MSNLGDYLGQLISEIAMARMQADLETVRLAELYASHPLLRQMAVPRLRLPDVDLDIPVLIKDAQPPRAGESARGGVPVTELRKKFQEVLKTHLDRAGVKAASGTLKQLNAALDVREQTPTLPAEMSIDVHRIADSYTRAALHILKDTTVNESALKEDVRLAFLQLRTAPPRLEVIVNSAEIREGATNDNVARIRLKITEQGVEWATVGSGADSRDLLVPE